MKKMSERNSGHLKNRALTQRAAALRNETAKKSGKTATAAEKKD